MAIYKSITELTGNTPLVELTNIEKEFGLKARLLAKVEFFNPAGSVKTEHVKMFVDAEKAGILKKGCGYYLSLQAAIQVLVLQRQQQAIGYKMIITMPETMRR